MNHQQRAELARAIVGILDQWGLGASQQLAILDLPKGTPVRALRRYRQNTPLPDDSAVTERVEHLIAIADGLRTTFPLSPPMGVRWLHTPHRRFNNRAPLAVMVQDGLSGLMAVRAQLDCSYAWRQTEELS